MALGRGENNSWSDRRFSQLEREEPVVGAVGQRLIPKKGPACFVETFKNKGCDLNFRSSLTWGECGCVVKVLFLSVFKS